MKPPLDDRNAQVLSALQHAAALPPAEVQELPLMWHEHWHPKRTRRGYPDTGWTLGELVGSQWINIHSRTVGTVCLTTERCGPDRRLTLEYKPHFEIGVWVDDYYCIDSYLRFDVLSVEQQLAWLLSLPDHPLLASFCEQHDIRLTPEQVNAWIPKTPAMGFQLRLF